MTPTGQTADGRWELGVRRTLPVDPNRAWALATAPDGPVGSRLAQGTVSSETPGEVRRVRWQPAGWERPSTVQLRVIPAATGTTVAIHHEGLPDADARETLLAEWTAAVEALTG